MTSPNEQNAADASRAALRLQNGVSAPFDAVPVFSLSYFTHWLAVSVREGLRVSSFFALPFGTTAEPAYAAPLGAAPDTSADGAPDAAGRPDGGPDSGPYSGDDGGRNAEPDAPADARPDTGSAAPDDAQSPPSEPLFRIFAVLSDDANSAIYVACTETGQKYPSLTPRLPQLHLFERELYEQHGITPEGHPWLKPVRFEKNSGPPVGVMDFYRVEGDEVHEVAVGPIHAGVIECGHFRFQCLGEIVMHLEISLGYHHRGLAALLTGGPHARTLPLMEVTAGDSTIAHTWAYCTLVEALADAPPSPRGQLVRALALELERLANHTGDLGAIAGDVGFLPTLSYCGRLRGDWLNMSALLSGSRFGRGLLTPGGCAFDVDASVLPLLKERLEATARDTEGAVRLIWNSPSVMSRLTGTGAVSTEDAAAIGLVGPAARACGLGRDVRHSHPLPQLPRPPERVLAKKGDVRARTEVRHREIGASVAFCSRLLNEFLEPADPGAARVETPAPLPGRIAVALVEGWRGEVCHVGITGADGTLASHTVTDPSFHNWMGLALALRNQQISDFPLCNKSFNLSYCGHDL